MKKLSFLFLVLSLCGLFVQAQNPKRFIENGKVGYKNDQGKILVEAQYDGGDEYIVSGCARVLKNGKVGLINDSNKVLVPIEYEGMHRVCSTSGTASVKKNGKWGVIEIQTHKTIIPFQYEDIGSAFVAKIRGIDTTAIYDINNGGWIPAKQEGKWGFISMSNNKETKFLFDDVDNCCTDLTITLGDKAFTFSGKKKHLPAVLLEGKWVEIVYDDKNKQLTTIEARSGVVKRGDFNEIGIPRSKKDQ